MSRVLDVSRDVSCLFSRILQILHLGNPRPRRRLDVPDAGQQNAQQALKQYTRQVALLVSLWLRFRSVSLSVTFSFVVALVCLRNPLHKNPFELFIKSKFRDRISRPQAHGCSVKEKWLCRKIWSCFDQETRQWGTTTKKEWQKDSGMQNA